MCPASVRRSHVRHGPTCTIQKLLLTKHMKDGLLLCSTYSFTPPKSELWLPLEFTVLSLEMRSCQGLPLNGEIFYHFCTSLLLCLNLPFGSVDTAQPFAACSLSFCSKEDPPPEAPPSCFLRRRLSLVSSCPLTHTHLS